MAGAMTDVSNLSWCCSLSYSWHAGMAGAVTGVSNLMQRTPASPSRIMIGTQVWPAL